MQIFDNLSAILVGVVDRILGSESVDPGSIPAVGKLLFSKLLELYHYFEKITTLSSDSSIAICQRPRLQIERSVGRAPAHARQKFLIQTCRTSNFSK